MIIVDFKVGDTTLCSFREDSMLDGAVEATKEHIANDRDININSIEVARREATPDEAKFYLSGNEC